jgi:hypothetical protein
MQALHSSESVQATQPYCFVQPLELDNVVSVSSRDTEEALELLSLSLCHGVSSRPSGGDA